MMLLTASVSTAQPDYVALAMVLALALIVAVMAVRKRKSDKTKNIERDVTTVSEMPSVQATAPGSAGQIKLHDVEPKTAALLMAIVANKTNKPLNELRFISIKEIK